MDAAVAIACIEGQAKACGDEDAAIWVPTRRCERVTAGS